MGCVPGKKAKFRDVYKVKRKLGEGGFGVVHQAVHIKTQRVLAVKMIDRTTSTPKEVEAEITIMKELQHHHVNAIVEVFSDACFMYIVTEQFLGGDMLDGLQKHMKERGRIPEEVLVRVLKQPVMAIEYIHGAGVIHRDVKGDNFLMDRPDLADKDVRIVLADFGAAMHHKKGETISELKGTEAYWSPECIRKKYSFGVDVWAIGVILYGLVDGTFPFKTVTDIMKAALRKPKVVSEDCWGLLKALLTKDPEKRPKAPEILQQPFFMNAPRTSSGSKDGVEEAEGTTSILPSMEPTSSVTLDVAPRVGRLREEVDEALVHRRQHMLNLLEEDHEKPAVGRRSIAVGVSPSRQFAPTNFVIEGPKVGERRWYEWLSQETCKERNVEGCCQSKDCFVVPADASKDRSMSESPEAMRLMLERHGIDVSLFGKGNAKTMAQFAKEIFRGEATLGQVQGKLLRVVDVTILRLRSSVGGKLLIEKSQKFLDDRVRVWDRLPGTKRRPHESPKQTGIRVLETMLQIREDEVEFIGEMEIISQTQESPSYPAVETLYRKQIAECVLRSDVASERLLELGLPRGDQFDTFIKGDGTSTWAWHTEKQCKKLGITVFGSTCAAMCVAPAPAPLAGERSCVEELSERLTRCGVDVSKFGRDSAKSIEDIADELARGECSLRETATEDGTTALLRFVGVVAVRVIDRERDRLLVEVKEERTDGRQVAKNKLPTVKQRGHENAFLVARRFVTMTLRIPESEVVFNDYIEQFDEERESPSYPGLKTLYRRQVIDAEIDAKVKTALSNGARTNGHSNGHSKRAASSLLVTGSTSPNAWSGSALNNGPREAGKARDVVEPIHEGATADELKAPREVWTCEAKQQRPTTQSV